MIPKGSQSRDLGFREAPPCGDSQEMRKAGKGESPGHIPGFSGDPGKPEVGIPWGVGGAAGKGEGIEGEKWEFWAGYRERIPGESWERLARGIPWISHGFSIDFPWISHGFFH